MKLKLLELMLDDVDSEAAGLASEAETNACQQGAALVLERYCLDVLEAHREGLVPLLVWLDQQAKGDSGTAEALIRLMSDRLYALLEGF